MLKYTYIFKVNNIKIYIAANKKEDAIEEFYQTFEIDLNDMVPERILNIKRKER